MVKITYKTGDKVFAKVKGYPPWPARVVGDTGKKKYNVLFYGTQETGAIKPEDLAYYFKYKDSYVQKYLKRAGYEDAVKQIEEAIKKDGGDGNDGITGDDSVPDLDMSDVSSVSSVSEKKAPKRKVGADDPAVKKAPVKGARRSITSNDSREDNSEEPVPKKPRRKSNASAESKEEDEASEKSKKSNDNGIKEEIAEHIGKAEVERSSENNETGSEQKSPKEAKKDEVVRDPEETTSASETGDRVQDSETDDKSENEKTDKDKGLIEQGTGKPKEIAGLTRGRLKLRCVVS